LASDDSDYSKELYIGASTHLRTSYIIMVAFVMVFFVSAILPYFNLQYQKNNSLGDQAIFRLAELDRLTLEQEKISKSIQNYLNSPTLAAIEDYKRLDTYFRQLELLQSQAVLPSNNLSSSKLETIVPTFLKCNIAFHQDINKWVTCNAINVADGVNKKIVVRYELLKHQIEPLMIKANENLLSFNTTALPLVVDEKNEIISKLSGDTDPDSWKQLLLNISGKMITWVHNVNNTLKYVKDSPADIVAWTLIENPRITYTYEHPQEFKNTVDTLNQSKNQIEKEIKGLSEKFEEVEYPIVGKVPLGFTTAVLIYPASIGVGSFICAYYFGQVISKRSHLHGTLAEKFDKELYPLWIEPKKVEPKTSWKIRIVRLVLFFSVPIIILLVTTYLMSSIPIKEQSIFNIAHASILTVSCTIGYLLIMVGAIIVVMKLKRYNPPDKPKEDPYHYSG
jgi:hypothetical protein